MSQCFYLSGTKCHSCEVIIEREVKKIDGVDRVHVSHTHQTILIEGVRPLELNEVADSIAHHGYRVRTKPKKHQRKEPIQWKRVGGVIVIVLALYVFLSKIGFLTFSPAASDPSGWLAVLMIGLVASVSSCTAVVGGLVVAVSSQLAKEQTHQTTREKIKPHIYFNAGRLIGFAGFGALIGLVGSAIELGPTANGLFVMAVAVLMILLGINLLELFPTLVFVAEQ